MYDYLSMLELNRKYKDYVYGIEINRVSNWN